MSYEADNVFAFAPNTERGKPLVITGDTKNGENFLYACGSDIVIRNFANPLISEVYSEHAQTTTMARYSPSGFYIASADTHGFIRIWDTTQREHPLKFEFRALAGRINDLAWTEDSKRIVAVGDGKGYFGKAFFFDTGASCGEISGHAKSINSVDIKQNRPYRCATASEDFNTAFFTGVPFKYVTKHATHTRFAQCVRYAPNGSVFASAGSDKKIVLYDGKEGTVTTELPTEHKGGIYGLAWSGDSTKMLSSSGDKTCKLWDMNTQQVIHTYEIGTETGDQQLGCCWVNDWLLSVSLDGSINYLDPNAPKLSRVVHGHNKFIQSVAYDKDTAKFYTGSYDGLMVEWDRGTGATAIFGGPGHTSQINQIACTGGTLMTAGMDNAVKVVDCAAHEYAATAANLDSDATGVAVGEGGLAVATSLHGVHVLRDGKLVNTIEVTWTAKSVDLSPDGATVAVGGDDASVHLYTLASDALTEGPVLSGKHKAVVNAVAFSPDGQWVASACHGRVLVVWELASNEPKYGSWGSFHTASINTIAWTPDSLYIASGGLDENIFIWSLKKKMKRIQIVKAHRFGVNQVMFLDQTTLASVGQDCTLRTWNVTHHA